MYKCEICGSTFEEPYINQGYDPMPDGFREKYKQILCPYCGSPYFYEVDE